MNTKLEYISDKVIQLAILVISIWLMLATFYVAIDNDDGFSNVFNSQFFIGEQDFYAYQRGPLLGLILTPAALWSKAFAFDPIDARPYHFVTAILLIFYLLLTWQLLKKITNHFFTSSRYAIAVAYLSTIPGFLFFSYAPFLNVDLFPGLLFLAMLYFTHLYTQQPNREIWLILMFLGLCAVLFKTTYALFWISIIAAQLLILISQTVRKKVASGQWRTFAFLLLSALCSAFFSWFIYALTLESVFYEINSPQFLLNPLHFALKIMQRFDASYLEAQFPFWLYLRNFPALGLLTTLLIIPASILAILSKQIFLQRTVLVWFICFIVMHLISYKEVRYIAFLIPVLTILLSYFIYWVQCHFNYLKYLLLLPLIYDLNAAGNEAARIFHPFYQRAQIDFFQIPRFSQDNKTIFLNRSMSFMAPFPSPLYADRYHRIFNMFFIARLYYDTDITFVISSIKDSYQLSVAHLLPDSLYFITYGALHRRTPWLADNLPTGLENFFQFAATTEQVKLKRQGNRFLIPKDKLNGYPIMLVKDYSIKKPVKPMISYNYFTQKDIAALFGDIPENEQEFQVMALRVHYLCDGIRCGDTGLKQ